MINTPLYIPRILIIPEFDYEKNKALAILKNSKAYSNLSLNFY